MDHHALLYMLERVKASCKDRYLKFYCSKSEEDNLKLLQQLESDGLVRLYSEDEYGTQWELG